MTKIFGIACVDARNDLFKYSERMICRIKNDYFTNHQVWESERLYAGQLYNKQSIKQPAVIKDDQVTIFCGQLFNYKNDCNKSYLVDEGSRDCSDFRFFHNIIAQKGTRSLPCLNGIYTAAIWKKSTNQLMLINDRFGLRPLYYCYNSSKKLFIFSSDLGAIVASGAVDLQINWAACSCFLRFGHHLGNDTFFKNIYALPPASVLKFVEGKIYLENYWNPAQITVNNSISYDDAIEGAGELFSQAIQRRLDICKGRNVMVFLSGGQDSRHIAAELHQYLPIVTYTTTGFGPYIANKILAKKATNVLGIKNEYFTPPNHGFLTYWWPRAHYFMDYEADLHQWILPVVESLPDEPWINFDGILGDVCQASVFLTQEYMRLSQDGDLWGLAEKATGPEPILSIFRPEIRNKLSREGVIEKTRREFQRYSEHPYQVNLTFLRNRTRRAVSLFASKLVILKSETVYPFADNDFYEFTMSIPPQYKMDRKFHRHVLDRYFPQMKEILTTKEISLHDYYKDEFGCRRQKKQYILWNLKNRLQQIPWLFHKKSLFTKASLDLAFAYSGLDRAYFFCNPAFAVFFDWVEQYFPEGAD